eukprot:UN07154
MSDEYTNFGKDTVVRNKINYRGKLDFDQTHTVVGINKYKEKKIKKRGLMIRTTTEEFRTFDI